MKTNVKFDIYAMITERIIEQLDKGIIPWNKPWTGTSNGAISRSTGRPYSLINQIMLKRSYLIILTTTAHITPAKNQIGHIMYPLPIVSLCQQ